MKAAERRSKEPSLGKKLFLLLAAMGGNNRKKDKTHNGQCDGDCANCPPHHRYHNVLSQIILDNTRAAEQIPKDARGRFIMADGTVFQSYLFDEERL